MIRSVIRRDDLTRLIWAALAVIFVISMAANPGVTLAGAKAGLDAWWNIVFPALLPFFIASEIFIRFGLVRFLGVLLEPVMRPLFNVPGAGSFVLCVGFVSGSPVSAMVTASLRSQGLCTRIEAERLLFFTNNASPLFMIVAVSVGMFGKPDLGLIIAGSHYLASLTLGISLRYYGMHERNSPAPPPVRGKSLVGQAFRHMLLAQRQNNKPPGQILGGAVRKSVLNLLNIGGFIVFFAVIIRLLTESGFIGGLARMLGFLLIPLGFTPEILTAIGSGVFEITIGCKLASEASAPLLQQVVAVGIILGWSGLSVHAQVATMIAATDIRLARYMAARAAHAVLAALYTLLFFKLAGFAGIDATAPVFSRAWQWQETGYAMAGFKLFIIFLAGMALLAVLALLLHLLAAAKYFFRHKLF